MIILEIANDEATFRELADWQRKRKKLLIEQLEHDFRLWTYKKKVLTIPKYLDLGVIHFMKDRLGLIETLKEFKFLCLTFKELSKLMNTITFYYCVYFFGEFIKENELEYYFNYIENDYKEEINNFLNDLAAVADYKLDLNELQLQISNSVSDTFFSYNDIFTSFT